MFSKQVWLQALLLVIGANLISGKWTASPYYVLWITGLSQQTTIRTSIGF